jgi:hypothetical protein
MRRRNRIESHREMVIIDLKTMKKHHIEIFARADHDALKVKVDKIPRRQQYPIAADQFRVYVCI